MPVAEFFSERRMSTCVKVFQQIFIAGPTVVQIYSDEPVEDKPLEELSKMYFEIVTPEETVSLPFLDMLVAFKMVLKYIKKQKNEQEITGFTIKTTFEDHEAQSLFNTIKKRIGFKVKSKIV